MCRRLEVTCFVGEFASCVGVNIGILSGVGSNLVSTTNQVSAELMCDGCLNRLLLVGPVRFYHTGLGKLTASPARGRFLPACIFLD
jgi:hypothetical protein